MVVRRSTDEGAARVKKELGCTENEAKNALLLTGGDVDGAIELIRKKRGDSKETRFTGGVSGQLVELPEKNMQVIDKLVEKKNSMGSREEGSVARSEKVTLYQNGILIGEKFHRMSQRDVEQFIEDVLKKGEVPSERFGLQHGEAVDVQFDPRIDEVYQEKCPGEGYRLGGKGPLEAKERSLDDALERMGSAVDLGEGVVFMFRAGAKRIKVTMGRGSTMQVFISHLEDAGVLRGRSLKSGTHLVNPGDKSEVYNRDTLEMC
jgi:predicted HTH domain antitoxin